MYVSKCRSVCSVECVCGGGRGQFLGVSSCYLVGSGVKFTPAGPCTDASNHWLPQNNFRFIVLAVTLDAVFSKYFTILQQHNSQGKTAVSEFHFSGEWKYKTNMEICFLFLNIDKSILWALND